MSILKSTLPGATLVCALTDVTQAHAQAYPHKWVRMIIPFVPGGRVGGSTRLAASFATPSAAT